MRIKSLIAAFFCLSLGIAQAQVLSVTATLTDSDGQTWNNGTCTITAYNSTGGPNYYNGVAIPLNPACSINSSGVLSASLYNTSTLNPASAQYQFVIQSNTSAKASVVISPVTSSDLSSTLSSLITVPRFPAGPAAFGYRDVEAQSGQVGLTYYNITTPAWRQCTVITSSSCSTWVTVGSGGGISGVTGTAPIVSSGGSTPAISITPATSSTLGSVKPDNTSITVSSGTISSTAVGVPPATQPGQIITSAGSGTTYAVQPVVFYQQGTDTISTVESECSSPCIYHMNAQLAITTTHTLASNVTLDMPVSGGFNISSGQVLTLASNQILTASISQHFFGSGIVSGLAGAVPVEWFGAIGFSSCTTGTDYTSNFQKAINSITNGGWVQLQPLAYLAANGISISTSSSGIRGMIIRDISYSSTICSNTQTNIVSVGGTSSVYTLFNTLQDLSFRRIVSPTGTLPTQDVAIYAQYAGGLTISNVSSQDSLDGIYTNGTPGFGVGKFEYINCGNGFGTPTYTSGQTINCIEPDSSNGVAENTLIMDHISMSVAGTATNSSGVTSSIINSHGTAINDLNMVFLSSSGGVSYGVKDVYTGSGAADSEADGNLDRPNIEADVSGVYLSGLNILSGQPSFTISGGYILSNGTAPKFIDCENTSGLQVNGIKLISIAGSSITDFYGNGCTNFIFNNNKMDNNGGIGVDLVSSSNWTMHGNNINGNNNSSAIVIYGYRFDSASLAGDFISTCGSNVTANQCTNGLPVGTGSPTNLGPITSGGLAIPVVGTPTVGQASCIKSAGPPLVIGYCSTVVGAGGACTCN